MSCTLLKLLKEKRAKYTDRSDMIRAASENAPTSTEVLQLASEQDGTHDGEEKEEQKRKKEEDWAVYTEINKKGAGNTMNRG